MKIIVKGFERVNRVCRNRLSEAALYSAATASIEPNPQCAHSGFRAGVGLLQAGQVRNPESLTVCSKNRWFGLYVLRRTRPWPSRSESSLAQEDRRPVELTIVARDSIAF